MKHSGFHHPGLTLISAFILGCNTIPYQYAGDGQFDNRTLAPAYARYHLELGRFNTSVRTKSSFQVGELPDQPFQFYLKIPEYSPGKLNLNPATGKPVELATVHLKITESGTGRVIAEKKAPLLDWDWTGIVANTNWRGAAEFDEQGYPTYRAFVTLKHYPSSSSNVSNQNRFIPTRGNTYEVLFEIVNPDEVGLELILEGSGGPLAPWRPW